MSIKNATTQPLTIGFTKTGPPDEAAWASPELIYFRAPRPPETWGLRIMPGEAATRHIKGEFYSGVYAMLRVYGGEHSLIDLLAISHDRPDRVDLVLEPGERNVFVIDNVNGKLNGKLVRR